MNAELKKGDLVLHKFLGRSGQREKYKIVDVCPIEAPAEAKGQATEASGKALYGKEIQEASKPILSFIIEPLSGGERMTVKQGEIELVT